MNAKQSTKVPYSGNKNSAATWTWGIVAVAIVIGLVYWVSTREDSVPPQSLESPTPTEEPTNSPTTTIMTPTPDVSTLEVVEEVK